MILSVPPGTTSNSSVIEARDFDLEATLESGQVFGFRRREDGWWEGRMDGGQISLYQEGQNLIIDGHFVLEGLVRSYFDLDRDLGSFYQLLASEERLAPLHALRGLRIIRQEPWKALAGFILSSNNNIKRIQGIWLRLCALDGGRFPSPQRVAEENEISLRGLGLGYRAPFLLGTAKRMIEELDYLNRVRSLNYEEAKALLVELPGVGEKIADCVLLFGFQKYEAFPVDVWMWRVMKKLFLKGRKMNEEKVAAYGRRRWGAHAGYVQQYLYHAARKGLV